MHVPFMNLADSIKPVKEEINLKFNEMISKTQFIGGPEISEFEKEFSNYCGIGYSVGCANGTEAIALALRVLDIGVGDTVLVPANTFIATSEAVTLVGANVDFIDVEQNSWTMNPDKIVEYLQKNSNRNVKAIIPVHLYGKMADMEKIMEIANEYQLKVIEDSSQAHGASINMKGPGHWGDIATFSFYPGKNLGAFGDAGAIVTNSKAVYERAKAFVNHGRKQGDKYKHSFEGSNIRMDAIQASILRIKLRKLEEETKLRKQKSNYYLDLLSEIGDLYLPVEKEGFFEVWHLFVIHLKNRDSLNSFLSEHDIFAGVHYPIPLHLQPAYSYKGYTKGSFPNAEYNAENCLSLPLWPYISSEQQDYVAECIIDYLR